MFKGYLIGYLSASRLFTRHDFFRTITTASEAGSNVGQSKPDLVEKYMGFELGCRFAKLRPQLENVRKEFQQFPGDTESYQVKAALYHHKIQNQYVALVNHKHNFQELQKMQNMFYARRRMLMILRSKDFKAYCYLIERLGLKDVYHRWGIMDFYWEGKQRGEPPDERHARVVEARFHRGKRPRKCQQWYRLTPDMYYEDPKLRALEGLKRT